MYFIFVSTPLSQKIKENCFMTSRLCLICYIWLGHLEHWGVHSHFCRWWQELDWHLTWQSTYGLAASCIMVPSNVLVRIASSNSLWVLFLFFRIEEIEWLCLESSFRISHMFVCITRMLLAFLIGELRGVLVKYLFCLLIIGW